MTESEFRDIVESMRATCTIAKTPTVPDSKAYPTVTVEYRKRQYKARRPTFSAAFEAAAEWLGYQDQAGRDADR